MFDVDVAEGSSGMAAVRQTLDYLCRLHQDPDIDRLAPALAAGFPDYLMSLLLMQLPHNQRRAARRPPAAAAAARQRARDYIESHLDEAVTLAELAALSGVSTRTLQNGFARFLGQSPIDYIRGLRLARTRRWNRPGRATTSPTSCCATA